MVGESYSMHARTLSLASLILLATYSYPVITVLYNKLTLEHEFMIYHSPKKMHCGPQRATGEDSQQRMDTHTPK